MENPSSHKRAPLEVLIRCDGTLPTGKYAGRPCNYPLAGRRNASEEPSIDCPRCHKEWSIRTLQSEIEARGIITHQKEAVQTQGEQEMTIEVGVISNDVLCGKIHDLIQGYIKQTQALRSLKADQTEQTSLSKKIDLAYSFSVCIAKFFKLGFSFTVVTPDNYRMSRQRNLRDDECEKLEIDINLSGRQVIVTSYGSSMTDKDSMRQTYYQHMASVTSIDVIDINEMHREHLLRVRAECGWIEIGIDYDYKGGRITGGVV